MLSTGDWLATAKEAHRVRFVLDRTPESIGLLSPTEIGLPFGLGLWGKNKIGLFLGLVNNRHIRGITTEGNYDMAFFAFF
jgi:hypothetical protein